MTPPPDGIAVEFLRYNRWANLRLIDACSKLTPEQLDVGAPEVYGSIYATLAHIVRSEAGYLRRITANDLQPPFDWKAAPALADIRPFAEQVAAALIEAAARMQYGDTLERTWDDPEWAGFPPRFKAVGMLIQVLNHGDEHRTNVTTLLAQQGIQPPTLDGWEYVLDNRERMGAGV